MNRSLRDRLKYWEGAFDMCLDRALSVPSLEERMDNFRAVMELLARSVADPSLHGLVPTANNQPDDRDPSRAIGWPSVGYQSDSQEKFNVLPANCSGSNV